MKISIHLNETTISSSYPDLIQVVSVEPQTGLKALVTFSDGTRRVIDLEPYLYGPIFESIRNNAAMFRRVGIDHGALAWPNGADIDTDTLYYGGAPPWATEVKESKRMVRETRRTRTNTRRATKRLSRVIKESNKIE